MAGRARGAHQAGVPKRIGEIAAHRERPLPFQIVAGALAGAINGAMLAALESEPHRRRPPLTQVCGFPNAIFLDHLEHHLARGRVAGDALRERDAEQVVQGSTHVDGCPTSFRRSVWKRKVSVPARPAAGR